MRSPGRRALEILLALALCAATALVLHAQIPTFTDPDSLYHARHASIYRTEGLFQSEFPWAWHSAIRREASNLWYGFHVLLIPFTLGRESAEDLIGAIRIAGPCITFASLALVWAALRRLELRWAPLWTLVFAFATADSLYRLTMVRPHPLSLGLALLLFAFLCEERPPRWAVFAAAGLSTWIHESLSWVPALLFLVVAGVGLARKRPWPLRTGAFIGLGLLAGALARPNPFGGLRLASIQVFTWLATQGEHVRLDLGKELRPFDWGQFTLQLLPITALAAVALVLFLRSSRERASRAGLVGWSSLALLTLFFVMSFAIARRANDLFVGFATLFAAGALVAWIEAARAKPSIARLAALAPAVAALVAAPVQSLEGYRAYLDLPLGPRAFAERYKGSALWLRDHAAPGEIVFNVHWDAFSQLFFWNPANRYVNGNDPVFLYACDPKLYWIAQKIETDVFGVRDGRAWISDGWVFPAGREQELHGALRERFGAAWLVAQPHRTPRLVEHLRADPRFELAFESPGEVVFRVRR